MRQRHVKCDRNAMPLPHRARPFSAAINTRPLSDRKNVARAGYKLASKHMSAQAAAGAGARWRGPSGPAAAGLLACGVVATAAACGMPRSRACGGFFATPARSRAVGAAAPPPPREESGDASVSGSHPHPSRAHLPRTVAQVPPRARGLSPCSARRARPPPPSRPRRPATVRACTRTPHMCTASLLSRGPRSAHKLAPRCAMPHARVQ